MIEQINPLGGWGFLEKAIYTSKHYIFIKKKNISKPQYDLTSYVFKNCLPSYLQKICGTIKLVCVTVCLSVMHATDQSFSTFSCTSEDLSIVILFLLQSVHFTALLSYHANKIISFDIWIVYASLFLACCIFYKNIGNLILAQCPILYFIILKKYLLMSKYLVKQI